MMSPELICVLPSTFGKWLMTSLFLRNTGSLLLFSAWEVLSGLLPQQVKVLGFTALACVLLLVLGTQAEDALKTTIQFFVVCSVSVTVMWRMGAF